MKVVTYHDPTTGTDKPAFIVGKNQKGKKPTFDLLVCDVPNNYFVKNVGQGKGVRQFTIPKK